MKFRDNICLDDCSSTADLETEEGECVLSCNLSHPYKHQNVCKTTCPDSGKFIHQTKECVPSCSDAAAGLNNFLQNSVECVPSCPGLFYIDSNSEKACMPAGDKCQGDYPARKPETDECMATCLSLPSLYLNLSTNVCEICPADKYIVPATATCVPSCEALYSGDNLFYDGQNCVADCGPGRIALGLICRDQATCPAGYLRTGDSQCVESCLETNYKYTSEDKTECLLESTDCPSKFTEGTLLCVASCPNVQSFDPKFSDGFECKASCPDLTFDLTCVEECPQTPIFTYQTPSNQCIENCSTSLQFPYRNGATCDNKCLPDIDGNPTYFSRDDPENICGVCPNFILNDLECVTTCPKYYGSNNHCVSLCNPDEFVQNDFCVASCDSGLYNLPDRVCVDQCSGFYPLETSNPTKCEATCPEDTFRDLNTCVDSCPAEKTFNDEAQSCLPTCQPGEIIIDGICTTGNCGTMFKTP